MGFHRATFVVGLAVGFIIGSRAGRERYDQIVMYSRKAAQSPQAQRAGQVISAKATDLSKVAGAKAKTAAARAPKVAGDAARKARERAKEVSVPIARGARLGVPKIPVPKPGWRSGAHERTQEGTQASVNGHGRHATTDGSA